MSDSEPNQRLGRFMETPVGGEIVRAFVPPPLPPVPAIDVLELLDRLSLAERALGRLDGITMLLPRQELFLYMYVRKEAVLSSQIEGTQSTLSDLLRFETEAQVGQPIDDIREVSNYVDAMMYGLERLQELPLSLRLIREMHARLLQSGRGGTKDPGEFRRSQNWIGGTRPGNALYVPPPVTELDSCLGAFERFMHEDKSRLPALIKAGLLHVQFETIHPFLDGNGRIGRMLITLLVEHWGLLDQPLLYPSLAFKRRQQEYYERLAAVRTQGDWEGWTAFFLECVTEAAEDAVQVAGGLFRIVSDDRARLLNSGSATLNTIRLLEALPEHPVMTLPRVIELLGIAKPTASRCIDDLAGAGILREMTGKQRDRVYIYEKYMRQLTESSRSIEIGDALERLNDRFGDALRRMADKAE